ncbi:MAG: ABC transporter permease [Acidobacteria bacterium]|nr:ABC transporter permease [Acidobacteriota bacterium]
METLFQDLRYGIRTLLKQPGFSMVAIIILALGIGASTAIFTVVNAALIRSLPYRAPEQLYHLWETTPQKEYARREFSYPDYQDYQQNQVFDGVAAYTGGGGILTGYGEPERIFSPGASANFFTTLGVEPFLGRTFQPGEDKPGAPRVVVLSYGWWQRRFGGDQNILGQSLTISGLPYTVVGILPPGFQFALRPADVWLPYQPGEAQLTRRFMHGTNMIARLKSDVPLAQAQTAMSEIASRIEREHQASHAGTTVTLIPLQEQMVGQVKPILLLLLGAVGFVLLIACANVASLLLTRSLARQKEIAIRAALGAGRGRIVRQLLTESVLLSVAGGVAGLLIARWGIDGLVAMLPQTQLNALPFLNNLHVDGGILAFACGLSLVTGVVFGLAPALQTARLDLQEALKEGGRSASSSGRQRLRSTLVVTEIALAVVLLVGAGLMMKSLLRLLQVNLGFNPENVLTMTVALPTSKYSEPQRRIQFHTALQERISALPGVSSVGAVNILPLIGGNTTRFTIEGDPAPPPGQEIEANIRVSDEHYFQTLGVPLLAGRFFDARDTADAPDVVIINKSLADRVFAGRDPIGRRLNYGGNFDAEVIVGVVGDVKITGLDDAIKPVVYNPLRQAAPLASGFVVRTQVDPAAVINAIRNECRALETDAALFNVRTVEEIMADSPATFTRRLPALLIGIFAGVALLLAAVGIYGVVAYSVRQQTHDIGIRMALGAQVSDITKMVLRQGLALALAGIGVGTLAAIFLTRLLGSLLFEVKPSDPLTFVVVASVLCAVSLLACWVPARRAAKVDPLDALRES